MVHSKEENIGLFLTSAIISGFSSLFSGIAYATTSFPPCRSVPSEQVRDCLNLVVESSKCPDVVICTDVNNYALFRFFVACLSVFLISLVMTYKTLSFNSNEIVALQHRVSRVEGSISSRLSHVRGELIPMIEKTNKELSRLSGMVEKPNEELVVVETEKK